MRVESMRGVHIWKTSETEGFQVLVIGKFVKEVTSRSMKEKVISRIFPVFLKLIRNLPLLVIQLLVDRNVAVSL